MLWLELFYLARLDIVQTKDMCAELGSKTASIFRLEFCNKRRATAKYLSSIDGKQSVKHLKKSEKKWGLGVSASNSLAESLHGLTTADIQTCGTVDLQNAVTRGQSASNNDWGRDHKALVSGKRAKGKPRSRGLGWFHQLAPELQQTAITTSVKNTKEHKCVFHLALSFQAEDAFKKEEDALKKRMARAWNEYTVAVYFLEQCHSAQCWRTAKQAAEIQWALPSETNWLEAVKARQ